MALISFQWIKNRETYEHHEGFLFDSEKYPNEIFLAWGLLPRITYSGRFGDDSARLLQ